MKFEELLTNLSKEIKPVYMINGGDSYVTNLALDQIKNSLNITLKDFNIVTYGDDYSKNMASIVESCQALPLIDNKRLIIVNDFVCKKNEVEKKTILKYLSSPCLSTCLVFFSTNKSEFFSSFDDKVESINCQDVSLNYIFIWLNKKLEKLGLITTTEIKNQLIDYCNGSLSKLNVETDKLYTIKLNQQNKEINQYDIENYITKDMEYVIFDLTNAICELNNDKVYLLIDNMIKNKEQPVSIISMISSHFRRLFFISRSEFGDRELGEYLGLKEYAIRKYRQQLKNFSQKQLKTIYDKCLEVEYFIKSGKMEAKNGLSYLVSSILLK